MNAKNFIDSEVLYIAQKYDEKLNRTEKEYILGLLNNKQPQTMYDYLEKEYTIDHSYMTKTLEDLKRIIRKKDNVTTLQLQRTMPDLLSINPVSKFTETEQEYAQKVMDRYIQDYLDIQNQDDIENYLSTKIKNYERNVEQYIPYFHNGIVWNMQNLATYNSMLYNVNLTRTAWNQSYKDSFVLDNDKFIINSHPFSCPHCLEHQNRVMTRQELEELVGDVNTSTTEILHPNCKCTLSLYWDDSQEDQNKTTKEDYELDQREKSIERILRRKRTEKSLYRKIGNDVMADKKQKQISRLVKEKQEIQQRLTNIRKQYYK